MHTLNYPRDTFDQDNTFTFEVVKRGLARVRTGYLFKDDASGKVYILQNGACIKSHYTDKDRAEQARLAAMTPVRDGDEVEVDGVKYAAKILGDFSDAGRLIKL